MYSCHLFLISSASVGPYHFCPLSSPSLHEKGVSINENSHKGNHLNTRPGINQQPVAHCAGCLISTTNNPKIQTQSPADRITTSLSLAYQSNNKQKLITNLTLQEAYTNHWTRLRRAETKRKKESNLEAWEKDISNTIKFKKIIIITIKRHRNTTQMKKQTRNTEVQINEEETGKLNYLKNNSE